MCTVVMQQTHRHSSVMGSQGFVTCQLSTLNVIPQVHCLVAKRLLISLSTLQVASGLPNLSFQASQL